MALQPYTVTRAATPRETAVYNAQQAQKNKDPNSLYSQITTAMNTTNASTKKRETEIRGLYDQLMNIYSAGGSYGQGTKAALEQERKTTLASGGQSLISAGLYNTTGLAGLSTQFSQNVAAPTLAKLEDLRMDKIASILGQKASFIENITDQQLDYTQLANILANQ